MDVPATPKGQLTYATAQSESLDWWELVLMLVTNCQMFIAEN